MSEILARLIRGETTESIHRGHLIVVDGSGKTLAQAGEPETVTFWRSAAKAFQAIPFLTSGAADAFGFTEKEIALSCASHSGERFHTELAQKMLEKTGLDESDLLCGVHPSFHKETREAMLKAGEKSTQLHNNCSGKHSAMLAFAKRIGADTRTYLSRENPVQKEILETVSLFAGIRRGKIRIGIDGCSAPNFAFPISAMAGAFARLINPPERFDTALKNACARIVSAMISYPEYIGGSVRLDTKIMKALSGKIVCKVGAEGVWCAAVMPCAKWKNGLAIALKIEDGDDGRARPAVAIELLRRLGIMDEEAEKTLGEFSPAILKNRKDIVVGKVVADFKIAGAEPPFPT